MTTNVHIEIHLDSLYCTKIKILLHIVAPSLPFFLTSLFSSFLLSHIDLVPLLWRMRTAMKNTRPNLRVNIFAFNFEFKFLIFINPEPKPPRDNSSASSSSFSNYSNQYDDRMPSSSMNYGDSGMGNDGQSMNDCVLHVMCSPMVSIFRTL